MNNNKPTFFSSDWHIGHANALKFDARPFRDLDHMHESLIARYNATVPQNGICYFLGDMGNKQEDIRKVITRLNGIKVLILGNHDKGMTSMYNAGFDVVMFGGWFYIGEAKVTMTHCPLLGVYREDTSVMKSSAAGENWHGEKRAAHIKCAMKDEGQFHLHGHIHSRKDRAQSVKILDRQFDVGVPANNYTPVSLSQIESWIANYGK
jgi:calcineurin-like phosphoesterase family protein